MRDSVADSPVRLFGERRPAFTGLDEQALIERIAGSAVAELALPRSHSTTGESGMSGEGKERRLPASAFSP